MFVVVSPGHRFGELLEADESVPVGVHFRHDAGRHLSAANLDPFRIVFHVAKVTEAGASFQGRDRVCNGGLGQQASVAVVVKQAKDVVCFHVGRVAAHEHGQEDAEALVHGDGAGGGFVRNLEDPLVQVVDVAPGVAVLKHFPELKITHRALTPTSPNHLGVQFNQPRPGNFDHARVFQLCHGQLVSLLDHISIDFIA